MNNIITQNQKNIKRYLPHEIKTRENAVKMYRNCNDIGYVCRKYHISRTSLWRWNKKYDGSRESLEDKSHRPLSKHPKEHTETEIKGTSKKHNQKVERSHRNDNERFYSYLKFYSLEDLRKQGAAYLKRSNRIPMAVLGYLTPKEKRAELEKA